MAGEALLLHGALPERASCLFVVTSLCELCEFPNHPRPDADIYLGARTHVRTPLPWPLHPGCTRRPGAVVRKCCCCCA